MQTSFDCIVIGAGIAGVTAAIYLKRAGRNVLLIEKNSIGGQIVGITKIENYPAINSIDGASFSMKLYEQIKELEIDFKYAEVTDIKDLGEYKEVITTKETITTKNIILAVGRIPRKLLLNKEEKLIGNGISYCAICDGNLYRGKEVAVVGGGNSAAESALYLANICPKVTMINRSDKLRADEILVEEIEIKENITILHNSKVTELIELDNKLDGVIINGTETLNVTGLFTNIGLDPDAKFLNNLGLELDNKYIIVDNNMRTNVKGVYACGDIIKKGLYQIVTAAGEGAIAATNIKG